jgi:O-glycosyl hydrolase
MPRQKASEEPKVRVMVTAADVYTLTSTAATSKQGNPIAAVNANSFKYNMPARSVSTLVFHP